MSIIVNSDYCDLLSAFNAEKVEYLIVGAHAVAVYGYFRYTGDFGVWVRPETENAKHVYGALTRFGAPLGNVVPDDFTSDDLILQIGVEPVRIDVITSISGVEFDHAWKNRVASFYGEIPTFVISRDDLIQNKKSSARPQDLRDVIALEKIGKL